LFFATDLYWIGILKDYFGKQNPADFKGLCVSLLILWDFKRLFKMTSYNQDFEHKILMDL